MNSIKISVITAAGYGTIKEQAKSLAKVDTVRNLVLAATASVADGTGITITATIARTESQRCVHFLQVLLILQLLLLLLVPMQEHVLPLQVKLVDHHFSLACTGLTAGTTYKVWCATDTTAVLSNAATITPVAQVYASAQPSAMATASVADGTGITITATIARTEDDQRCIAACLQVLLI